MSSPATTRTAPSNRGRSGSHVFHAGLKTIILIVSAVVLLCAAAVFYVKFWPFSQRAVVEDLREATDSSVSVQSYQPTYFPPGCVLYGLEFRHGNDHFKLIEIQKLVIRGSYSGILRRHVPQIVAFGAHVFIPSAETTFNTQHSNIVVDELIANGSFVEFEPREKNHAPLRFDVHEAAFKAVQWGSHINYHLKFHNPNPPGEISADGKFGPWSKGQPGETPFSGDYTFEHANLGVYHGIDGILSSKGKFEGRLHHLNVTGTTNTPDFHVKSSGHKFNLTTKFDAYVNGQNGDTFLNRVDAHYGGTDLVATGSVAKIEKHKGKFTRIHLSAQHGRIEDVLGLFTRARAPMSGDTALRADVEIPPGDEPFLRKVELQGRFGIGEGSFTKPDRQKGVDELSAGARGQNNKEDPETVMTDLNGQVKLVDGVATFSDISFSIPGAKARMRGTYGILPPHRVNLHGQMHVDTKISKTTSGVKSLLLKIMDPIFKKKKHGEVVPVHILGTYEKPDFGLDLNNNQAPKKQ